MNAAGEAQVWGERCCLEDSPVREQRRWILKYLAVALGRFHKSTMRDEGINHLNLEGCLLYDFKFSIHLTET